MSDGNGTSGGIATWLVNEIMMVMTDLFRPEEVEGEGIGIGIEKIITPQEITVEVEVAVEAAAGSGGEVDRHTMEVHLAGT